jgi:hypothetical protein
MKSEKRKNKKTIPVLIRVKSLLDYAAKVSQPSAAHPSQNGLKQQPKSQSSSAD